MKAVLIGPGMIAETHAKAIADLGGVVRLHGVMSRSPAKAEHFCKHWGDALGAVPKVYESVEEIAGDAAVDFVIICTPPNVRKDLIAPLAAAGKPILLEKPIERTAQAAQEIVELCEAAGVPLGIVFHHRARPASLKLSEIVATGALGPIAAVEARVPWWRPQSYYDEPGRGTYARDGGGVMLTQAIHPMELMIHLAGPVETVQAMARTTNLHDMETEDFVSAGLEFANGAVGTLFATTASYPGGTESIALHCQNGSAILAGSNLEVHWRDGGREHHGAASKGGTGANPMDFSHALHRSMIEDFAAAVTEGRPPRVTGRQALHVHDLIDAITASSETGASVSLIN